MSDSRLFALITHVHRLSTATVIDTPIVWLSMLKLLIEWPKLRVEQLIIYFSLAPVRIITALIK